MKITSKITFQHQDEDHPRMLVIGNIQSWQRAFKETQGSINRLVTVRNAKLLKVVLEDEE